MNREILFRGFAPDENGSETIYIDGKAVKGKWVYGWYCKYPFGMWPCKPSIIPSQDAEDGNHRFIEVIPSTVGQYTGLTDQNNVKIFEGDILKSSLGWIYAVEWEKEGRFLGFTKNRRIVYVDREPKSKIIGNIHSNPELLKEVEQ